MTELVKHTDERAGSSELVATFRFALAGAVDHIDVPDTVRVIRLAMIVMRDR